MHVTLTRSVSRKPCTCTNTLVLTWDHPIDCRSWGNKEKCTHCIAYFFLLMNQSRTTVGLSTQGISLATTTIAHKLSEEEGSCWQIILSSMSFDCQSGAKLELCMSGTFMIRRMVQTNSGVHFSSEFLMSFLLNGLQLFVYSFFF